ncbi:MAG: branched-chain amino acid ABC transporter permease [Dehalococcoidia bacterium]|nr:branched-chain amino acid ABC transporter permease [Dehalococcoidia bacterium]
MLPGGVFNTKYELDLAILRTKLQWVLLAVGLILVFTFPMFGSAYWLSWLTRVAITIVALLGLHILTGLCGQVSIGHAAFLGVGAYTVAILATNYDVNGWLCLPLCGLAAGAVGVFFGLPSFRLKMFFLAISTLAASAIIVWCFQHFESVTGGFIGLGLEPLKLGGIDLSTRGNYYILAMAIMVLATIFAKNIQRSSAGRAFVAIRDNELAAQVSGIAIFRYKLLAFFIGCLFAGVAGWLWAYSQLRINPDQFRLLDSIWYLGMLIIGGMGSTSGVFFGALFLRVLEVIIDHLTPVLTDAFPSIAMQLHVSLGLILYGAVIVLFMLFFPRGIYYLLEKIKIYYRLHPYSYWGS